MDEMQGEGVTPDALEAPDLAENHAAHWQRSLSFIRIVAQYFGPEAAPDPEARQRRVIEALAARWADTPPQASGDRGRIDRLARGDGAVPACSGCASARGGSAAGVRFRHAIRATGMPWATDHPRPRDHPQFRFHRLMADLGLHAADIAPWVPDAPPAPARNRLVSLALRPAPVTDRWMEEGPLITDLNAATEGLSLIEAADARAEALAIALALRQAAEGGTRAALVSPDRMLTRRVAAALDRWGILPDDSAGQPLSLSPPGRFLRHTAALFGRRLTMDAALTLLKHPLTTTGAGERGPHLRFTRELELHLRRHGPAFPDGASLGVWARTGPEDGRIAWADWLGGLLNGLDQAGERPLLAWIETHLALSATLAAGPGGTVEASELWRQEAGEEALRVMSDLLREAGIGGDYAPGAYADLVTSLLGAASVRHAQTPHPTIAIWGTLEARVQGADLVILGGLNDGVWPETPPPDPWLSRQMRLAAGLLLPERRIGLSAHDFQQAIAAPRVVLSRATRDADAQTVPSRWLNRLTNLMGGLKANGGPEALAQMRARGAGWLTLAGVLDAPEAATRAAPRPAPRPPVDARPRALPVTDIQTLIRDPYAIYAKRILRLRPLDPLRPEPDPRERGNVLHRIVEHFVRDRPEDEPLDDARARLMQITDRALEDGVPWPSARRLWRARLDKIARAFVAAEALRLTAGEPMVLEKRGEVALTGMDFTLNAKPDRIDLLRDGRAQIYDYKSGKPPSEKEQRHFNKQLLLEAAMTERGAFKALGPRDVAAVSYIRLGGGAEEKTTVMEAGLADAVWAELHLLIARYQRRDQGYSSRRAVQEGRSAGDYDQLARFGEWEMNDAPEPGDVG